MPRLSRAHMSPVRRIVRRSSKPEVLLGCVPSGVAPTDVPRLRTLWPEVWANRPPVHTVLLSRLCLCSPRHTSPQATAEAHGCCHARAASRRISHPSREADATECLQSMRRYWSDRGCASRLHKTSRCALAVHSMPSRMGSYPAKRRHLQIAVLRWQAFTGQTATRPDGTLFAAREAA